MIKLRQWGTQHIEIITDDNKAFADMPGIVTFENGLVLSKSLIVEKSTDSLDDLTVTATYAKPYYGFFGTEDPDEFITATLPDDRNAQTKNQHHKTP